MKNIINMFNFNSMPFNYKNNRVNEDFRTFRMFNNNNYNFGNIINIFNIFDTNFNDFCNPNPGKNNILPRKDVTNILSSYKNKSSAPIIVAMVKDNKVQVETYGDSNPYKSGIQKPTSDTLVPIGSVSKVFTTTLLADMVKRGEVNLDDPVQKYLPPEVNVPKYNGKEITLRDLATHTSGLPNNTGEKVNKDSNVKDLFGFIDNYTLKTAPGEKYEYSNIGFALLSEALGYQYAKSKGQPYVPEKSFEKLLDDRILTPLGMNNTKVSLTPKEEKNAAWGYDKNGKIAEHIHPYAGSGGIYSTANDMAKFLQANINANQKVKNGTPLTDLESSMVLAQKPLLDNIKGENGSDEIGLGWNEKNDNTLLKTGSVPGFNSIIEFSQNKGVFIIAGSNNIKPGEIADKLINRMQTEYHH